MILSVLERIQLLQILPFESDISTLKIVRKLQDDLGFSEEEHGILQFKREGETYTDIMGKEMTVGKGHMYWMKEIDKDVQIGEKATDIIKNALKTLDAQRKINIRMMDLYERFIPNKEV